MKKIKSLIYFTLFVLMPFLATSQVVDGSLQYFRYNDERGINVFETTKEDTTKFDGLKVRVGADFAVQAQFLKHKNDLNNLQKLYNNFNQPTYNLRLDAQLADGVRVNILTYLSSRFYEQSWVMGGYLQIDNLSFLRLESQALENIMKIVTLKGGQMEINYGDQHFRRSNNAYVTANPFISNTIMDAYANEVALEIYAQTNGFIGMLGFSNGAVSNNVTHSGGWSYYGKVGYDKQFSEDFRGRLTASAYGNNNVDNSNLYNNDRGGSRVQEVMIEQGEDSNLEEGRVDPEFTHNIMSVMINPFIQYKNFEFFGLYEYSQGRSREEYALGISNRVWQQYDLELIYRFGGMKQFHAGAKYNNAWGKNANKPVQGIVEESISQNRYEIALGWFLTRNVFVKSSYLQQNYIGYDKFISTNSDLANFSGGKFDGFMIEAGISF